MSYTYNFNKSDFPYNLVNSDRLQAAILASPITKQFDSINSAGDVYGISFTEELSNSSGTWNGTWDSGTAYVADDVVYSNGTSYICTTGNTNQEPPNATYWSVLTGDLASLITVVKNHPGTELPTTNVMQVQTIQDENLSVSGEGTGGFSPDPTENPHVPSQGEVVGLSHDADGNTRIRGAVYTDEGSFRDDFTGDSIELDLTGTVTFENGSITVDGAGTTFYDEVDRDSYVRLSTDDTIKATRVSRVTSTTGLELDVAYQGTSDAGTGVVSKWGISKTGSATITVSDSKVILAPGTVSGDKCGIFRHGDFPPVSINMGFAVSQRVANQKVVMGFSDTILSGEYYNVACLVFEGTDDTKVTFLTANGGHSEETEVTLEYSLNTSQYLCYEIEVAQDGAFLYIQNKRVASHCHHTPQPYSMLYYGGAIINTDTVASATTVSLDGLYFNDNNVVNITNAMRGKPIEIKTDYTESSILAYTQKQESPKVPFVSPNYCDKTTWYDGSVLVEDETATDSGDHTTYTLANQYIIDNYHGKISFEDYLTDTDSNSYRVIVKVNDTTKTEQDPHIGSGGDYTIDYDAGSITFLSALQAEDVVTVDYHYADSSLFLVKPAVNKTLVITRVELVVSEDIIMNDTFVFQGRGLVDVYAPQLMPGVPSGTLINLGNPLVYKTFMDIINDSNKAYPAYPVLSASNWRGLTQKAYMFVWDYEAGATKLRSLWGDELQISAQHDVACGGAFAYATVHTTSEDAPPLYPA